LYTYGKLIGSFYLGLFSLWAILIGVGYVFLGRRVGGCSRQCVTGDVRLLDGKQ
jgi:hypothetical protein